MKYNLCDHGQSDEVEEYTAGNTEEDGVLARFTENGELVDEWTEEAFDDGEL